MKQITINNTTYTLEFSFKAVKHKKLLKMMFEVMSGAYTAKKILQNSDDENPINAIIATFDGSSDMVADIPEMCEIAFYAGLLENNPVSEEEAFILMKQYMIDNKLSFKSLYDDLRKCMEDDGFFDLSGLNETISQAQEMQKEMEEKEQKKVIPMDHQKKQTQKK